MCQPDAEAVPQHTADDFSQRYPKSCWKLSEGIDSIAATAIGGLWIQPEGGLIPV